MGNCTSKSSAKDVVSTPRKDELKEGAFKFNKDNRKVVYVGDDSRDDNLTAKATLSASASASITSEESSPINPRLDSASKVSLLGEIREYLEDDASTQVTDRKESPAKHNNQRQGHTSCDSVLSKEHGGAILHINRGLSIVSPLPFEDETMQTEISFEDKRDNVKIPVNDGDTDARDSTSENLTIGRKSHANGQLGESLKKAQALLGEVSDRRDRVITQKMARPEENQSVEIVNVLEIDSPESVHSECTPTPEHDTASGVFSYDTTDECDEELYWKEMQSGTESTSINSEDEKFLLKDETLKEDIRNTVLPASYSYDNTDRDRYFKKDTIQLAPTTETELESLDEIINSEEVNGCSDDDNSIDTSEWSEMTDIIKLCEENPTPEKGKRNPLLLLEKRHLMFSDEDDTSSSADMPDSITGDSCVAYRAETSILSIKENEADEQPKNSPSVPISLKISQDTLASQQFSPLAAPQESFLAQKEASEKMPKTSPDHEDSTPSKPPVRPQNSVLAQKDALEKIPKTLADDNDVTSSYHEDSKLTMAKEETETLLLSKSSLPKSKSPVPMAAKEDTETLLLSKSYVPTAVTEEKPLILEAQIPLTMDVLSNSTTATTKSVFKVVQESHLSETTVNLVTATTNFTQTTDEKYLPEAHILSPLHVNMEQTTVTEEAADSITTADKGTLFQEIPSPSPSDEISLVPRWLTVTSSEVKISDSTSVTEVKETLPTFDEQGKVKVVVEEKTDTQDTTTDEEIFLEKEPPQSDVISNVPKWLAENSLDDSDSTSVTEVKEILTTFDEPETLKVVVEGKSTTPDTLESMSSDSSSCAIYEKEENTVLETLPVPSRAKTEGKSTKVELTLVSLPIDDTRSSSLDAIMRPTLNVPSTDSNTIIQQSASPIVVHPAKVSSPKSKLRRQSSKPLSSSVTQKKASTLSRSQQKQSTTTRSITLKSSSRLSTSSPLKKASVGTTKSPLQKSPLQKKNMDDKSLSLTPNTRRRQSAIPKVHSPPYVRSASPYKKSTRNSSIPNVSSPSLTPNRRIQQESPFSDSRSPPLKSPSPYKSLMKICNIDDVPLQISMQDGTPGGLSLDTDTTTPVSIPWDEPSSKTLSMQKTRVARCASPVNSEIKSTTGSLLSYSSQSSILVRKRQMSTQNKISQYQSPKACSDRWNPALYRSKRPCSRCHSLASEKEKQKFELNGHSTTITLTSGGCNKSCTQFFNEDIKDGVSLCRICFNACHRPAKMLTEEACRSLEY